MLDEGAISRCALLKHMKVARDITINNVTDRRLNRPNPSFHNFVPETILWRMVCLGRIT